MSVIYIILLVFSIGAIYARLFRGDIITDINRTELTAFKNSKIEALVFEIEKSSKEHQFNVIEARLKQLLEKSKKVSLSEAEFKEMEDLEGKNKKTYALPNKKSPPAPEMRKPRLLRGIYELPANGTAICQTIRKEKLIFSAGEPVRFEQLENPTVFQVMNDNIPFLKISQRTYTTGPALTGGPICLRASGGKKALVRTVILD
ncbi:hypothetical protein KKD72_01070 [Patescibacteria group bacterium]|nr:hypothetical protein [Patescibacteria group bacterium]